MYIALRLNILFKHLLIKFSKVIILVCIIWIVLKITFIDFFQIKSNIYTNKLFKFSIKY